MVWMCSPWPAPPGAAGLASTLILHQGEVSSNHHSLSLPKASPSSQALVEKPCESPAQEGNSWSHLQTQPLLWLHSGYLGSSVGPKSRS